MNSARLDAAILRIDQIHWHYDRPRMLSHVALMKEYLRRTAVWSAKLNKSWQTKRVESAFKPPPKAPKEYIDSLLSTQFIKAFDLTWSTKQSCEQYLDWLTIADDAMITYGLQDPYEPLIRLFEPGGQIQWEHTGFVEVSGKNAYASIPLTDKFKEYLIRQSLPSLDDATLNQIDDKHI